MQILNDLKLDFDSVLLRPMTSSLNSRSEVDLIRSFKFLHSTYVWQGCPIIATNMDTIGTLEMAKSLQKHRILTALHKFYDIREIFVAIKNHLVNPDYLIFSTGIRVQDIDRIKQFKEIGLSEKINFILIDVPNGYIPSFFNTCKKMRDTFPDHVLMAGNVVTQDVTEHLIQNCGVDIVRVGIGGGGQCSTRAVTGVGYPQLSAVIETSNAAHGLGGHVISDGGCKTPGDIAKAFGGGADFVCLGSMLAGHDECNGEIIQQDGKKFMKFYGMSSTEAMNKYYGGVAEHRASEGKCTLIDYKGSVEKTTLEILGGVRSTCSYIGAKTIKQMPKRATFVRIK